MASSKPGRSLAMSAAMDSDSAPPRSAVERRSRIVSSGPRDLAGVPADPAEIARVDALRRSLGCSQSELARMIGVSQSSLSRLFRLPSREHRGPSALATLATCEGLSRIESALKVFATGHQAPGHAKIGPTYRLLIAEDDPETVALYTTLFTEEEHRLRYEITVATTVAEVIQRLRSTWAKRPYDLLVMDLGLGDRSGSTGKGLLGQLRQRPSWVPPHLLVVSGISSHHLRDRLADLAKLCATFLAKPFDIDELLDSAYALVTGKKQTSRNLPSF